MSSPLKSDELEALKSQLAIAAEHGQINIARAVPFVTEADRIAAGHEHNETYSGNSTALRPDTLIEVADVNYDDDQIQGTRDELTIYLPTDQLDIL